MNVNLDRAVGWRQAMEKCDSKTLLIVDEADYFFIDKHAIFEKPYK